MSAPPRLDAVDLQVLVGGLRAACDEMGAVLVRSAHSPNITERRDCSTALFGASGEMIAQAEHIPVHLGAMPASVAAVRDEDHRPGVSWILNDPFAGGSHLPDITVVTPVFAPGPATAGGTERGAEAATGPTGRTERSAGGTDGSAGGTDGGTDGTDGGAGGTDGGAGGTDGAAGTHDGTAEDPVGSASAPRLIGFAAARAHHADVGGRTPGSMPADSTTLEEEGVVITPRALTPGLVEELAGRMRHPAQRRADLRAQVAACEAGAARLADLAAARGADELEHALDEVLAYGERRMRAAIDSLPLGEHAFEDLLEGRDGPIPLTARVTVGDGEVLVDLTDGPDQGRHNLNCPRAVTESACLFAVRAAVADAELPTDDGTRRRVRVRTRPGSILDARPWPDGTRPAVVAGNVETSSRVADLVLGALGRALGQGTMNNLTLGDDERTMYETIGGGQGALPDADGPTAVHVAMSNTRNTPVEALEVAFPVRVVRYEVRRGSGGDGAHRGGDGVVRELRALAPLEYQVLGERRTVGARGARGGEDGAPGRHALDGETLPPKAGGRMEPGQSLRIETPGGGGCGRPADRRGAPDG